MGSICSALSRPVLHNRSTRTACGCCLNKGYRYSRLVDQTTYFVRSFAKNTSKTKWTRPLTEEGIETTHNKTS